MLYYMYCVKLNRSDEDFWHSTLAKITTMINIYADEQNLKISTMNNECYESKYFSSKNKLNKINTITSMSQII